MPNRRLASYLFLTHNARENVRFSEQSKGGVVRKPYPYLLYQLKNFLTNNILAWFVHNWHIKPRSPYPSPNIGQVYALQGFKNIESPVSICLAADWASSTIQSAFVGDCIRDLQPDYTVHIGDTYYTGISEELESNFGPNENGVFGYFPRGSIGSFALLGNHEMYSSGGAFFNMIADPDRGFGILNTGTNKFSGQHLPFFCLRSEHWTILGLDSGYDSLHEQWFRRIFNIDPDNEDLKFPDPLLQWLQTEVKISEDKRGIIILSHHDYISAFGKIKEFPNPAKQLARLLGTTREIIWIWGHEHRFAMYNSYMAPEQIPCWGRCIGNGGMPNEHSKGQQLDPNRAESRNLELYDDRIADTFHFDFANPVDIGYNGYAHLLIDQKRAIITYYGSYWNGNEQTRKINDPLITEVWQTDNKNGTISRIAFTDHTIKPGTPSLLTYWKRI